MINKISLSNRIYDPLLSVPLKPLRKAMSNALPHDKNIAILDLCCGTGDQLLIFELAGYKNLYGLDLDPGMIAYAKRNSETINYIEGNASDTGLPDVSFDIVMTSLAIHDKNQALREAILKEIARLLKPDGFALIADFCFDERTKFMGRFLITAVERFAGGDHYLNFKDYTQRGGMMKIIPSDMSKIQEVDRIVRGAIAVWKLNSLSQSS